MFRRIARPVLGATLLALFVPLGAAVAPHTARAARMASAGLAVSIGGALRQNYYEERTVHLYAGTQYRIAAFCDDDCSDLDLKLFSPYGNLVASDTDPNDTPMIWFTPSYSGTYTIRTIMAACSNEPCSWWGSVTP